MARFFLTILALSLMALPVAAANVPQDPEPPVDQRLELEMAQPGLDLAQQSGGLAKADVDTVFLIGGPDRLDGGFEDAAGNPSFFEWTSVDLTASGEDNAWHVADEPADLVIDGVYSMVCAADIPTEDGIVFGYGNYWRMSLVFTETVTETDVEHPVRITATMAVDTEEAFDYVYLQVNRGGDWQNIEEAAVWDGDQLAPFAIDFSTVFAPGDYTGPSHDEIQLRFYFESDEAWSDQDGLFDSDGACWLDNVTVYVDDAEADYEDFEDGVSDRWLGEAIGGCGDFAALYSNLQEIDPCGANASVQVAFVDDGMVCPGTGGTPCITWCYGPGGYIVNNTGGLLGPPAYVHNFVASRPIEWVAGHDAMQFHFTVYRHEPLSDSSAGVFYRYFVRSTSSDDPAMLEYASWDGSNYYYGGPDYIRQAVNLTASLAQGRKWVQVGLGVMEFGWNYGYDGADGSPAPYFDDVRLFSYPYAGPSISTDHVSLAQDNFPEQGDINFDDMGSNWVRFDMARDNDDDDQLNVPGDSVAVSVVLVREGASLPQLPQMVVRMKANPLFDDYRTLPPGFSRDGAIITGLVVGDSTYNDFGQLVQDRYNFDLPDTGFIYPGDVIHYCFEAWDDQDGDVGHTLYPADTTGFASFEHAMEYHSDFIFRALPTLFSAAPGDQPRVLLWNDFANRGVGSTRGECVWYYALKAAGMLEGQQYDIFYTVRPDGGVGNGLGGRATSAMLAGYDILLYTCGDLSVFTLGHGDYDNDPSLDLQVLTSWFDRGGKKAFFTGDGLVSDLNGAGPIGQAFLNDFMGVRLAQDDVSGLIGGQTTPLVRTIPGIGIFPSVDRWIAYGGCPIINSFNAVTTTGNAVRIAEFTDPNGNPGVYPYAAAVYHHNENTDTEVVIMPYDFGYLHNAPDYTPPAGFEGLSARAILLRDLLQFFGQQLEGPIGVGDTPLAAADELSMRAYPNPFNPQTTLALDLPHAGQVCVKIYNLRGELVRTLHDGHLVAGPHELVWDGRDGQGARSASGVYFAETRALDQTLITRMALIK